MNHSLFITDGKFYVLSPGLEYVGGVPADILKPVLMNCTASQLYTIEEYNPVSRTEYLVFINFILLYNFAYSTYSLVNDWCFD